MPSTMLRRSDFSTEEYTSFFDDLCENFGLVPNPGCKIEMIEITGRASIEEMEDLDEDEIAEMAQLPSIDDEHWPWRSN